MEDPYGFSIPNSDHSSSQEDSLFNGEGSNLSPNPPPPSTAFDEICSGSIDDDVNAIFICSAPETQLSDSGDEFKTPPEESRRSSSEEAPSQKPYALHESAGNRTSTVETDGGDLDGETPDLGFSQGSETVEVLFDGENQVNEVSEVGIESVSAREKRIPVEEPSPPSICVSVDTPLLVKTYPNPTTREDGECSEKRTIELPIETDVLSDGHVPASKVCIVDHESSRVEEKRSPIEEPSPSKITRASIDSTVSVKTPSNPATIEEGDYSEEMEIDCPDETEVKEDMNMETEVYFVDSGDTVVLDEDYGEENVNQTNNVEFFDVQQVQEEDEGLRNANETNNVDFSDVQQVQEEDKGLEIENETNNVEYSDVQNGGGDNGEEEDDNLEESMALILELLDLLAEEGLQDLNKNHGTGDFLKTDKRRGMNFPEPKWWHDAGIDCGGSS